MKRVLVCASVFALAVCIVATVSSCGPGSGDDFVSIVGPSGSLGGANSSTLAPALLTLINDFRNQWNIDNPTASPLPFMVLDNIASSYCQDYVKNDMGENLNPKDLENFVFDDMGLNPSRGEGITAKGYDTADAVFFAWKQSYVSHVFTNMNYTHLGVGVSDPDAKWGVVLFRP